MEIRTEIEIAAPPERVWEVLTDLKGWDDWNPFIKAAGRPEAGTRLLVEITPPGLSTMKFSPTVLVAEAPRRFEWLGRVLFPGLFDGHHAFHLEPAGEGRTLLKHFETFRGLLVGPVMRKQLAATELGFKAMNGALKERVEKGT
jgi:hypothetical protein